MRLEAVLLGVILVGSFIYIDAGAIERDIHSEQGETGDAVADAKSAGADNSPTVPTLTQSDNCTLNNGTGCESSNQTDTSFKRRMTEYYNEHKGMLMRSFYVLIGVTGIVIIYFIVRTVRLRTRRSKSKKYGVIATSGSDNLEMTPLDQDDDDEDLTVFEVNGRR